MAVKERRRWQLTMRQRGRREAVRICGRIRKNVVKKDWSLGGLGHATILFQSRGREVSGRRGWNTFVRSNSGFFDCREART